MISRRSTTWLLLCVVLNAIVLWILAAPRASFWFSTDEAIYACQAQRLLDGQVIYRDFFQFITPLFLFVLAAWMKLVGGGILSLRALMILITLGTSVAIYVASRLLGVGHTASLVPSLTFSVLRSRSGFELNHYTMDGLLETAALGFLCGWVSTGRRIHLVAAGALVSADILTTQNLGAHLLAGVLLAVAFIHGVGGGSWRRNLGGLIAGAAPLPLAYISYALATGSLGAMYRDGFAWVLHRFTMFDPQDYWFHWLRSEWGRFLAGPGAVTAHNLALAVVEAFCAPAAVLVALGWLALVCRYRRELTPTEQSIGASAIVAASMFTSIYASPNNLLARASLTGYILAYALIFRGYRAWAAARDGYRHRVLQKAMVLLCAIALAAPALRSAKVFLNIRRLERSMQFREYRTARGWVRLPVMDDAGQIEVLAFLRDRLGPGEHVCAVNWSPWVYYFGGFRNPGPSEYLMPFFTDEGVVEDTIVAMERTATRWIIQDDMIKRNKDRGDGRFQALNNKVLSEWRFNRYRDANYHVLVVLGSYAVYVRNQ